MNLLRATARPASCAAALITALAMATTVAPVPAAADPGIDRSATVRPSDEDSPRVIADPTDVLIPEGHSGSFSVRLSHPPSGTVYLGMRISGTGVWAAPPVLLVFTPEDWSTPKSYRVASVSDADRVDDVAVFTLSVFGYLPDTVTLHQIDQD